MLPHATQRALCAEASIEVNVQGVSDGLRYVLTFYLVKEHFDAECGLYRTAALRGLVPRAHIFVGDSALATPSGDVLPAAIVLERGETLQEWSQRRMPDLHVKAEVRPCAARARRCTRRGAPARMSRMHAGAAQRGGAFAVAS
jgi:hypothetical protein